MTILPSPARVSAIAVLVVFGSGVGWWVHQVGSSSPMETDAVGRPTSGPPDGPLAEQNDDQEQVGQQDQRDGQKQAGQPTFTNDRQTAEIAFDSASVERRLFDCVDYLAADELEGRGVGTRGLEQAAQYIANEFHQAGLQTDHYDGTPFQQFARSFRMALGLTNEATLIGPDGERVELRLNRDFTPLSLSGSGTFNLPIVFAGYGITAERLGYDDYAGVDVEGKAVIVLRHEPQRGNPQSVFNGLRDSDYAYFVPKIANAVEHGAAAVLLCTDRYEVESRRIELGEQQGEQEAAMINADRLLEFQIRAQMGTRRIPVLHCRRHVIERIVKSSVGRSLAELETAIDETLQPQSQPLEDWRIAADVSVRRKARSLKNVIGVLNGAGDLAEEAIVVGAHYDHLGYGGWGSLAMSFEKQVHNGADDNASGTAVVIEAARHLSDRLRSQSPRRQVLFIAFTAEEQGLVGSARYVNDPLVPLDRTVAMVNLDMVGRLRQDVLTAYGTGTAARFDRLIDRLGSQHGLQIRKRPGGSGPSDHASFFQRGVPVLHFFTGFHGDYHRPGDDAHKVNVRGMRRIAGLTADLVESLCVATERPQPTQPSPQSLPAIRRPLASAGRDNDRPARAWLGVTPARNDSGEGVVVAAVAEDGPAARAGCRRGDVIQRVEQHDVTAPDELQSALDRFKPGQKVTVLVRRGVVPLELQVTLGSQ